MVEPEQVKPPCGPECCTNYERCETYKPKRYIKRQIKELKKQLKELKDTSE